MPDKRSAEDSSANSTRKTARTAAADAASSCTTAGGASGGASAPAGSTGAWPPPSFAPALGLPACAFASSNAAGKQPAEASNLLGELKEATVLANPARDSSLIPFSALSSSFSAHVNTIEKTLAAALHAGTFTKKTIEKEDFRCFIQVQNLNKKAWYPRENLWQEIRDDEFKLAISDKGGIKIMPFVDNDGKLFKMIPYGPAEPKITDVFGCGVCDLAPGSSMQWQFDNPVEYSCGGAHVTFIVVKISHVPPCNGSLAREPDQHMSLEIEDLVRAKFHLPIDQDYNGPFWSGTNIIDSQRDFWAEHALASDRMNKQLFQHYSKLQSTFMKLHRAKKLVDHDLNLSETARKDVKTTLKLSETALKDIKTALECMICLQTIDDKAPCVIANCGHVQHMACYEKWKLKKSNCGICRKKIRTVHDFHGFTAIAAALNKLDDEKLAAPGQTQGEVED